MGTAHGVQSDSNLGDVDTPLAAATKVPNILELRLSHSSRPQQVGVGNRHLVTCRYRNFTVDSETEMNEAYLERKVLLNIEVLYLKMSQDAGSLWFEVCSQQWHKYCIPHVFILVYDMNSVVEAGVRQEREEWKHDSPFATK